MTEPKDTEFDDEYNRTWFTAEDLERHRRSEEAATAAAERDAKREAKRETRSRDARTRALAAATDHSVLVVDGVVQGVETVRVLPRAERIDRAREMIEQLSDSELIETILAEFNVRRFDEHDNATDPPGLYNAAVTSMRALLGDRLDDADAELAENLAAVGRGVSVRSKDKDATVPVREINELVEAVLKSGNLEPSAKPKAIALTLEKRFRRPVDADAIATAIRHDYPRRITEVAIEVGVYGSVDRSQSGYYRDHHRHVKGALRLIDPTKKPVKKPVKKSKKNPKKNR